MRDDEFERIRKLKQIVSHAARGGSVTWAIVTSFAESDEPEERDAVRRLLLGIPVERALRRTLSRGGEAWGLLRYLVSESRVNSLEASKRAVKLSSHFERWAQVRRERSLEQRVIEMRAHILSTVLGAVVSLFSSLAPLISSLQISQMGVTGTPSPLPLLGMGFSLVSSVFLGLYLSPKRAYLDPILSSASYLVVMATASPITAMGQNPWVVK